MKKKLAFLEYEKRLNLDELYNKFFENYDIFTTLSKINEFYRENKKEAEKQKDEDLVKAHTRAWARAKRKEKEFLSKGSKSEKESVGITGPIYDDDSNPTYILPSGKEIKESELKKSQK